jgi:hypothetical protein
MNLLIEIVTDRQRRAEKKHRDSNFRYNEEIIYDSNYFQRAVVLHAGKIVHSEMFEMARELGYLKESFEQFTFDRLACLLETANFIGY